MVINLDAWRFEISIGSGLIWVGSGRDTGLVAFWRRSRAEYDLDRIRSGSGLRQAGGSESSHGTGASRV